MDAHNIVPVWLASDQIESSARSIRPKIHRLLPTFLVEFPDVVAHPVSWVAPADFPAGGVDWAAVHSGYVGRQQES